MSAMATKVEIRPGGEWMPHSMLSMARGERGITECPGTVRFVEKNGRLWLAECDELGCSYAVGATERAIEQSFEEREPRWYQR